jgi:hypothetical protein
VTTLFIYKGWLRFCTTRSNIVWRWKQWRKWDDHLLKLLRLLSVCLEWNKMSIVYMHAWCISIYLYYRLQVLYICMVYAINKINNGCILNKSCCNMWSWMSLQHNVFLVCCFPLQCTRILRDWIGLYFVFGTFLLFCLFIFKWLNIISNIEYKRYSKCYNKNNDNN